MGESEGTSWKMRAIWSSLGKAGNCYSAAPQLQADQHHPPVQRSDLPPCKALGMLSFPAPGGWERRTFPPILWILSSQRTTACYMQCGNGGKIPLVFGKELNAPSLLPGHMHKRPMELQNLWPNPLKCTSKQETSLPTVRDAAVVCSVGSAPSADKRGSHLDCWGWFSNLRNQLEAGRLQGPSFKSQQTPLSSLSLNR